MPVGKCRLHRAACLGLGGRTLLMDIYPRSKYELRRTSPLFAHLHISQNSNELTHLALAVGGRTGFGRESKASDEVATIFCDLFPHFLIFLFFYIQITIVKLQDYLRYGNDKKVQCEKISVINILLMRRRKGKSLLSDRAILHSLHIIIYRS